MFMTCQFVPVSNCLEVVRIYRRDSGVTIMRTVCIITWSWPHTYKILHKVSLKKKKKSVNAKSFYKIIVLPHHRNRNRSVTHFNMMFVIITYSECIGLKCVVNRTAIANSCISTMDSATHQTTTFVFICSSHVGCLLLDINKHTVERLTISLKSELEDCQ